MDFKEYVFSLKNEQRLAILKELSEMGNANEILESLFNTPPCYKHSGELRVNEKFLLWFNYKGRSASELRIVGIDKIKYFYHSTGNRSSDFIELVLTTGEKYRFRVRDKELISLWNELEKYIHSFDNITDETHSDEELKMEISDDQGRKRTLCIRGNSLYSMTLKPLSNKIKEMVEIGDIRDIVWCEQCYYRDSDFVLDNTHLCFYLRNSKLPIKILAETSEEEKLFELVLELKKRVPHIIYSPDPQYHKIFSESPEKLMSVAKEKHRLNSADSKTEISEN